jgi:hypothetical protein
VREAESVMKFIKEQGEFFSRVTTGEWESLRVKIEVQLFPPRGLIPELEFHRHQFLKKVLQGADDD